MGEQAEMDHGLGRLLDDVAIARRVLDAAREPLLAAVREAPREHPDLYRLVRGCRDAGVPLQEIGDALGLTRERARQLIARGDKPYGPKRHSVELTSAEVAELRRLYQEKDPRNPLYHTPEYRARLAEFIGRGVTCGRLAATLGLTRRAIQAQVEISRGRVAPGNRCGAPRPSGDPCRRLVSAPGVRCFDHADLPEAVSTDG